MYFVTPILIPCHRNVIPDRFNVSLIAPVPVLAVCRDADWPVGII